TSLVAGAKYTTGPYQRAAWLLTQIRARIGEEAFWGALRAVLADHALDSIDSETFVRSFSPALDDELVERIVASLDAKSAPRVGASAGRVEGAPEVPLTVSEPARTLVAPIGATVIDPAGAAVTSALADGEPLVLSVPLGGYLAADEADVHPTWAEVFAEDPG